MKYKKAPKPEAAEQDAPADAKPQRVSVADKAGNIARPYEADIGAWLAKGWQRT